MVFALGYNSSWASLVHQMVNYLPAVQKMRVQSLGQEYPLEKAMATHSSILAWRIPWTEEHGELAHDHGIAESDMTDQLMHFIAATNLFKFEFSTHESIKE